MNIFEEMQTKCVVCGAKINGANSVHNKIITLHDKKYPVCDKCVENAHIMIHTKYETLMRKYRLTRMRRFSEERIKRGIN